jgi:hypothetical protein
MTAPTTERRCVCGAMLDPGVRFHWTSRSEGHYVDAPLAVEGTAHVVTVAAIPDNRSEAEIQLAIRRTLETLGYEVADMSQDRPTRQAPGVPDLWVMGHGRTAWMECKRPGGAVSPAQKRFHAALRANGADVQVVRSEADAIAWHREREKAGAA